MSRSTLTYEQRKAKRPHGGQGHLFIGVPLARCEREPGCKETRTWGPPIDVTHPFTRIGGGAVWHSRQIGEGMPTDATMGPYADEDQQDPQGAP